MLMNQLPAEHPLLVPVSADHHRLANGLHGLDRIDSNEVMSCHRWLLIQRIACIDFFECWYTPSYRWLVATTGPDPNAPG